MSAENLTLSVDCGGGGIKAAVLDAQGTMVCPSVRVPTPYPLSPALLVEVVKKFYNTMPTAHRLTLGMPGMIRHGVVIATPHYVCKTGPRSKVLPSLVEAWSHCNFQTQLSSEIGIPALVLNDAEVAGAGAVSGNGYEMMLTLGTGLGNSIWDGGKLAPHLELSHLTARWGLLFDDYVGEPERLRMGDSHWSRRVRRIILILRETVMWDRLYIGGGNAAHITENVRKSLGEDVVIVPNDCGIRGGVRAWELLRT